MAASSQRPPHAYEAYGRVAHRRGAPVVAGDGFGPEDLQRHLAVGRLGLERIQGAERAVQPQPLLRRQIIAGRLAPQHPLKIGYPLQRCTE